MGKVRVVGGAGWRAIKEGIRRARSRTTKGKTVMRYGSRQTKGVEGKE